TDFFNQAIDQALALADSVSSVQGAIDFVDEFATDASSAISGRLRSVAQDIGLSGVKEAVSLTIAKEYGGDQWDHPDMQWASDLAADVITNTRSGLSGAFQRARTIREGLTGFFRKFDEIDTLLEDFTP